MFKDVYKKMNDQISPDRELIDELIKIPKKKRMRLKPVILVAAVLAVMFAALPAVAVYVPQAYEIMYGISPEIAQYFTPVQESCVSSGVKMEVISAYIHGDTAEILISLKDLEGGRIDETTDLYDSYSINTGFDCSATCRFVQYDSAENEAVFCITITQFGEQKIEGDKITFKFSKFISQKQEISGQKIEIDLTKVMTNPQTHTPKTIVGGGLDSLNMNFADSKLLVPQSTTDIDVSGIRLSGIGIVNGKLHVQQQIIEKLKNDNHGFFYLENEAGERINSDYSINFVEGMDTENRTDYQEEVFSIPSGGLDGYTLCGDFVVSGIHVNGSWKVTFPLVQD